MKLLKKIKNKKKENKKTTTVEVGSLYDLNKTLVEQNVTALTEEELQNKKNLIVDFVNNSSNTYYMLLCNEKKDYTIFHRQYDSIRGIYLDNAGEIDDTLERILIDECLPNRGQTKSIELTENKDAIEIWLSIDGESFCYYFFPYDMAIIEC